MLWKGFIIHLHDWLLDINKRSSRGRQMTQNVLSELSKVWRNILVNHSPTQHRTQVFMKGVNIPQLCLCPCVSRGCGPWIPALLHSHTNPRQTLTITNKSLCTRPTLVVHWVVSRLSGLVELLLYLSVGEVRKACLAICLWHIRRQFS